MDRQLGPRTEVFHPPQLIVDQRSERRHIHQVEPSRPRFGQDRRDQRQERGFRLAARGRSGDDQVPVFLQERCDRTLLNVAQFGPALVPDPTADRLSQQIKG